MQTNKCNKDQYSYSVNRVHDDNNFMYKTDLFLYVEDTAIKIKINLSCKATELLVTQLCNSWLLLNLKLN